MAVCSISGGDDYDDDEYHHGASRTQVFLRHMVHPFLVIKDDS